ncbi:hypothetical protein STW0522ENT62_14240 [Enterobacter kobei]|uniref:hypothetical protein n=1 Tax=Enterobacter kobei TaxID=208224 RepID=UPI0018A37B36|nr:hypothetical protein [Enterobacter kobei]BBV85978.1 hypothetical protein STW0522ENT62_14240 [Enterobacter kobei]
MLSQRKISYQGFSINITMINAETFIYELNDEVRMIESANSNQVMYVDSKSGSTAIITRDSVIYRELLHRIVNGSVVEDGTYQYQSNTVQ